MENDMPGMAETDYYVGTVAQQKLKVAIPYALCDKLPRNLVGPGVGIKLFPFYVGFKAAYGSVFFAYGLFQFRNQRPLRLYCFNAVCHFCFPYAP